VVFPHAGSGASAYFFLARLLQPDPLEVHIVQYPGRETRMKEPPLDALADMISLLATELAPILGTGPYACFGHSMGALLAFEFTRHLQRAGAPLPRHLFLSGRLAPQTPGPCLRVGELGDVAFLEAVGRRYQALPAELLANRELLEILLPSLRADFRLVENHVHIPGCPLAVAATVLNGREDPGITAATATAWQTQFVDPIAVQWFDGGHFFLARAGHELRPLLAARLADAAPSERNR
jgi:surfactin synthase thioesterase subunit